MILGYARRADRPSAKGLLDSQNHPKIRFRTTLLAVLVTAFMVCAASAQAASLQLPARVDATVAQGESAPFSIPMTAGGGITCATPAVVAVDSLYSINSAGDIATGDPSDVAFTGANQKGNSDNCDVTWDGAPDPYQFTATATAASSTPLGDYQTRIAYNVTNTGGTGPSGKLGSAGVAVVTIHVIEPTPVVIAAPLVVAPPEQIVLGVRAAPRPVFGQSAMLTLVKGTVRYRKAGGRVTALGSPVIVPNGTTVDATDGVVKVTVEHSPGGVLDSADAWGGSFKLRQDMKGVTTLTLVGKLGGASRAGRAKASRATMALRVKKRHLWVNAKGNFKTRGKRASAITRGTYWLTEESTAGTAVVVKRGAVAVRDFGLKRTTLVRAGHSYLARKPARLSSPRFTG